MKIFTTCSRTAALGFSDDQGRGPSSLELRTGQLKVSAGWRPADDPLEIHTPTAIATLLGTEVLVEVHPTSGDTTSTSFDHQIRVNSTDSPNGEGVVISSGESVTVRKGAQPEAIQTADLDMESDLHTAAAMDPRFDRATALKGHRHRSTKTGSGPI